MVWYDDARIMQIKDLRLVNSNLVDIVLLVFNLDLTCLVMHLAELNPHSYNADLALQSDAVLEFNL